METQQISRKVEIITHDDGSQSDSRPRAFPLWATGHTELPRYADDLRRPHPMGFVADE